MALLDDLNKAEIANGTQKVCRSCDAIAVQPDEDTRAALTAALSGTIGVQKLCQIMASNGWPEVTRRDIIRHRSEGHTS